tara:strand:- start:2462 stop:3022 length:561 start_codon:yes stop_codon:yes gene_type:complete
MRIISGKLGGKKINFSKIASTRPLKDSVKENIFNVLLHSKKIGVLLENSKVLDLYSGFGSFGLECISRGAKKATFVEKDKKAFEILRKNINQLAVQKSSNAINQDIINLQKILKSEKYNIIFLDPPYNDSLYLNYLKILKKNNFFEDRHIVIVHREAKKLDDFKNVLKILVTRQYGRSKIFFGSLN